MEYANSINKPVFPLLLQGKQWFRYITIQHLDVTDGSLPHGKFFDRLGKYAFRDKACHFFQIPSSSKEANFFFSCGERDYQNGKDQSALENFSKAIEIDPMYADAYYERVVTYYKLRNYPAAITDYSKSIEIDPRFSMASRARHFVYIELGMENEAEADSRKYIELTSTNVLGIKV